MSSYSSKKSKKAVKDSAMRLNFKYIPIPGENHVCKLKKEKTKKLRIEFDAIMILRLILWKMVS